MRKVPSFVSLSSFLESESLTFFKLYIHELYIFIFSHNCSSSFKKKLYYRIIYTTGEIRRIQIQF